tara:strand:- start:426 stop:1016 length:591 start_codon:yes stop_codon:yes gene_type:complete
MISWTRPPNLVKKIYPLSHWECWIEQKFLFSFDDGPGPQTNSLLDLSLELNIKFAFFIIPFQMKLYPDIVQRMVDEEHIVGSHFMYHNNHMFYSKKNFLSSLNSSIFEIEKSINKKINFCRVPYGRLSIWQESWISESKLEHVMWTLDSKDYNYESKEIIIERINKNKKTGDIILFHDGNKHHPNLLEIIKETINT